MTVSIPRSKFPFALGKYKPRCRHLNRLHRRQFKCVWARRRNGKISKPAFTIANIWLSAIHRPYFERSDICGKFNVILVSPHNSVAKSFKKKEYWNGRFFRLKFYRFILPSKVENTKMAVQLDAVCPNPFSLSNLSIDSDGEVFPRL